MTKKVTEVKQGVKVTELKPGAIIQPPLQIDTQVVRRIKCPYCLCTEITKVRTYQTYREYRCSRCVDGNTGKYTVFHVIMED